MRKPKSRTFAVGEVASLGCEVGPVWHPGTVSLGIRWPDTRVVPHHLPSTKSLWGEGVAFPENLPGKYSGPTLLPESVYRTPAGHPPTSLCTSVPAELAQNPEVLTSNCLQKWAFVFRLSTASLLPHLFSFMCHVLIFRPEVVHSKFGPGTFQLSFSKW